MYTAHYATPPPGYSTKYDYRTPPVSPSPGPQHYYSPRFSVRTATPSPRGSPKVHSRHASQDAGYAYASPRMPPQYSAYGATPRYYTPHNSSSQRAADYVSGDFERTRQQHKQPRSYWTSQGTPSKHHHRSWSDSKHRSPGGGDGKRRGPSHAQFIYTVIVDENGQTSYYHDPPPPPYEPYEHYHRRHQQAYWDADPYDSYDQVPIYTEAEATATPHRSRARRASHSSRPTQTPPKPKSTKPRAKATDDDARRAGIPAGYCYKNWDPSEEPIVLLGSVFDANSLGKWVYDWTVFHYGVATPMSEMAGDLWLLLIQLAGKVKRAEESMRKIRKTENRELVEDFLESGERLWVRFEKLLKSCEEYMWRATKKEHGEKKPAQMGKNSGCEFVDSIFGRDRELEKTEKLMTGIRLWSMRFDANCEEILRNPSA
jgi:hypothetical protein